MSTRIGLIPGIIRKEFPDDRASMLNAIAKLGFQGFEWGLPKSEDDAKEIRKIAESYGLKFVSAGADKKSLGQDIDSIINRAATAGCENVINFWSPCDTREHVFEDVELYNKIGPVFRKAGLKFCYHNHDHEFKNVFDGKRAIDILLENTDPARVFFVSDTYWAQKGGMCPAALIRRLGKRAISIHLRDYTLLPPFFAAKPGDCRIGSGMLDIKEILTACTETGIEFISIEQDSKNPFNDIALSLDYVKSLAGMVEERAEMD